MFMNLFLSILTLYCIYQSLTYLGFILVLRSGIRIQFSCPLAFLAAATGALSAAERSYPMSEVRGRSREDPMQEGRRPRGVIPRPRSGAAAESARLRRRRGATLRLRSGAATKGVTQHPRSGVAARRSYPASKDRGYTDVGGPRRAIPR